MGNKHSLKVKSPVVTKSEIESSILKAPNEPSNTFQMELEKHLTNNDSLQNIQKALNTYEDTDFPPKSNIVHTKPEEQQAIETTFDIGGTLAKSYKLLNSSNQALQKAKYAREEKQALEQAIANNITLANSLAQKRSMPNINTKERVSEINNNEFRKKQLLVNRLMYIIYFILYAVGLGLAMASGFITMRILSLSFGVGLLYLIYSLIVSESFWKTYGDISMKIAKGTVKEVVKTVGPVKKCPARCVIKKSSLSNSGVTYNTNVEDKYPSICSEQPDEDGVAAPYDYEYSQSNIDGKDFRDCEIGKYKKCKDNRQTSFVCKWGMGIRPDNEPEYLNSSVPCHYYNNRVNVKNENL